MAKSTHKSLKKYLGIEGGETEIAMLVLQTAQVDERILEMFGTNIRPVCRGISVNYQTRVEDQGDYPYFRAGWDIG